MRRAISILTCLAVALIFFESPFMHVHEHAENRNHAAPVLHMHFAHHHAPSKSPQFSQISPDDDAHDQVWVSDVVQHIHFDSALVPKIAAVAALNIAESNHPVEINSGHDPPKLTQSSPRSPPLA